jgi:phenylacetic acid degradation operon negative regulatory protein
MNDVPSTHDRLAVANNRTGPAQPRQLIVSIYGLYARAEHNWLSLTSLIRLMADLGVDGQAVRSSVSRLKRRGTLHSVRVHGTAGYALSATALEMLREGDARIFDRRRATLADGWVLVVFSIPERERHRRHELRVSLTRLGFGTVSSGAWVAPGPLAEETCDVLRRRGLDTYVDMFKGQHLAFADLPGQVQQWWDLDTLAAQYRQFIDAYSPLLQRWNRGPGSDQEAFADYLPMLTAWRRLPYLDPGLPLEVLPGGWVGLTAGEVFADLNARLATPARRHAMGHIHATSRPARSSRLQAAASGC